MKALIFIPVLFLLNYSHSHAQNVEFSGAIGWSSQNEWSEESKLRRQIKTGYIVRSYLAAFLGYQNTFKNPEIYITKDVAAPRGGRFEIRSSDFISYGIDVCYTNISLNVRVVDSQDSYDFKYKHERLAIIPIFSFHPFHRNKRIKQLDPFITFGVGYRKGTKSYTTYSKYGVDNVEEVKTIPIAIMFSTGVVYYPIKPLGIRAGVGYGLSTISLAVVLRIS
ncbi:MAG: hypothetical protein CL840_08630 [Crocinitomicaceae bacterium]|nr:hypothetical protein [Crocinitomicaceae bacterium]|tara:strand:+ start:25847 stop:26512 length:666 start_codon:yes stop_codon:yes gene_type:complete